MSWRRWSARWSLLAVVPCVLVLVFASAAIGDDVPFVSPVITAEANVQLLTGVSLQPADLRPPAVIKPYGASTIVRGQVSLDLCGADFPSENLRLGRFQVGAYVQHEQVASVEAILYHDTAAAKQALAELEHARASCPSGFAPSAVAGEPPVKTRFRAVPRRFAAQPGVQRMTLITTLTTKAGEVFELTAVYQRRGPIVVGLYGSPTIMNSYLAREVGGMAGLANVLATRLAATPSPSAT